MWGSGSGVSWLSALRYQGVQEGDQSCKEGGDAPAMEGVPLMVDAEPVWAGGGYAVIAGDEEEDRSDDGQGPEDGRGQQVGLGRGVAMQPGLRPEQEEAERVPKGHDRSEQTGEFCGDGTVVELPDGGVEKERDGKLVAGEEGA